MQALARLCELTECDVRSCLNTLQLLARKGRPIKVSDLTGLHVGQKDINKGAFTIWQDLLQDKVSHSSSAHSGAKKSLCPQPCRQSSYIELWPKVKYDMHLPRQGDGNISVGNFEVLCNCCLAGLS